MGEPGVLEERLRTAPVSAQLDRVYVRYPHTAELALRNVTLTFLANTMTAVVGSSGAGKTTLLRTLNGLVHPYRGEVWVAGQRVRGAREGELRRLRLSVGMIFQHFNLVKRLSALDNVLSGRLGTLSPWRAVGVYSKADRELAWTLLERVGLADYAWQRSDTLSGGQQQRVAIARALAQQPRLILADEPVSALDVRSAHEVMTLLREITRSEGIAVVVNLHALGTVQTYTDTVVGLREGQVAFEGSPAALTSRAAADLYGEAEFEGEFSARGTPTV